MSSEAPKLPTLPFIAGDVALLAVASTIAVRSPGPLDGAPLIAVVVLVALGAVLLAIPFVANYGRRIDARLRERQDEIAALAQTTATSAEQLSIAVSSLHGIADTASRSARMLEGLPARLQERIHELKAQLNEVNIAENEALEQEIQTLRSAESDRLVGAIDVLGRQVTEIARLEAAFRQQAAEAAKVTGALAREVDAAGKRAADTVAAAARELDVRIAGQRQRFADDLAAAHAKALATLETRLAPLLSRLDAASLPPAPPVPAPATPLPPAPVAEPPAPPAPVSGARPRRTASAAFEGQELDLGLPPPPVATPPPAASPAASTVSPARASPDGVTRLLVTAYIGIGNRLFARGVGPGLSPDKGTPLQFVSIGKWRWESADASSPVTLRLLKNDETEAVGAGPILLEPGKQRDVTATF